MTDHFVHPGDLTPLDYINNYLLDNGGESIWSRESPSPSSNASINQQLRLNGFRCKRTGSVGRIIMFSGGTAAGATPTLVKVGAYHRNDDDTYSLVGATPNTVTMFAGTNATYNTAFAAPWYKFKGDDYLIGVLIVTGAALPTIQGPFTAVANTTGTFLLPAPVKVGCLPGQTDLPTSFARTDLISTSPGTFHGLLIP